MSIYLVWEAELGNCKPWDRFYFLLSKALCVSCWDRNGHRNAMSVHLAADTLICEKRVPFSSPRWMSSNLARHRLLDSNFLGYNLFPTYEYWITEAWCDTWLYFEAFAQNMLTQFWFCCVVPVVFKSFITDLWIFKVHKDEDKFRIWYRIYT